MIVQDFFDVLVTNRMIEIWKGYDCIKGDCPDDPRFEDFTRERVERIMFKNNAIIIEIFNRG